MGHRLGRKSPADIRARDGRFYFVRRVPADIRRHQSSPKIRQSLRLGPMAALGGSPVSGKSNGSSASASESEAACFKSHPAQKGPPSPQNTATLAASSRSNF